MPSWSIERASPERVIYSKKVWAPDGSLISSSDNVTNITMNYLETAKQWVRTPNFWVLRRNGAQLPDNDFLYGRLSRQQGMLSYEWTGYEMSNRVWRQISVPTQWWAQTPASPDLPNLDLMNRLIGQAKRSNFSLPITLVEAGRTVGMVTNTARTIAGTIFDLRRGNLVGALSRIGLVPTATQRRRYNRQFGRDPGRAAADAWLQYQYGWKPLLNDVKNGAEALAEAVSRNGDSMTTRVTASHRDTVITSLGNYLIGSSPATTGTVTRNCRRSRTAIWRFKPRTADLPGLFGLTNPMEVVWEIIPFSFVADWFLPIGNYLSALDVPFRFQHVGGCFGYRKATTWITEPKSIQHQDGALYPGNGGQFASAEEITVRRDRMFGPPEINLSDLRFGANLNASRVTSAIALLRQQASRLGR